MSVKFNPQQETAINFYKGPCAVIAGAGSGKSTVLVNRIDTLITHRNVPEEDILAISFTKNTALDLKAKLKNMGHENVNTGTFHGICSRLLAEEGKFFPNEKMIQEWQIEKAFNAKAGNSLDIDDIKSFISYQKNYLKTYIDEFVPKESAYTEGELRAYFKMYEEYKQNNGLHDFDDYLIDCLKMLKEKKSKYTYDYILVDEHQDSNLANNMLIKELIKTNNVFAVFDFRQAIYTFRGGNPEYCMNFAKEWENATIINLDTNYRSSSLIVNKANRFIEQYYGDYEHYSDAIAHKNDTGNVNIISHFNREMEGKKIVDTIERLLDGFEDPNEFAVLYRLNSHSAHIEHELMKRGIEYDITSDGSFFKRKEISGILSYLKLIINPHDDGAFLDIFKVRNYPLAFFSGKLLEEIKRFAGVNNLSMYEALLEMKYSIDWQRDNAKLFGDYINKLRLQKDKNVSTIDLIGNIIKAFQITKYIEEKYKNEEEKKDRLESLDTLKSFVRSEDPEKFLKYVTTTKKKSKKNCIKLMSLHASKGLEFKNVFLIGVEDGKFPHERSPLLDEARLFYVGVTRPKENLTLSEIGTDNRFVSQYR